MQCNYYIDLYTKLLIRLNVALKESRRSKPKIMILPFTWKYNKYVFKKLGMAYI